MQLRRMDWTDAAEQGERNSGGLLPVYEPCAAPPARPAAAQPAAARVAKPVGREWNLLDSAMRFFSGDGDEGGACNTGGACDESAAGQSEALGGCGWGVPGDTLVVVVDAPASSAVSVQASPADASEQRGLVKAIQVRGRGS